MKIRILTQVVIVITIFLFTVDSYGQVTIGSDTPPNKGALLDLTEGATTAKGLALPRVQLTDLQPTNGAELSASIGGTGNWVLNDHTALVVYNTKADYCAVPEAIYEGLYVFDGTEWQYLGRKEDISADVYTFTDSRDNEIYKARTFGTAGDWMLENVRYIPKVADGFTHTAAAASSPYTAKYWCYPWRGLSGYGGSYNSTQAENEWDKRAGTLYNWAAATNNQNSSIVDQGQVSGITAGPDEVENTAPLGTAPHKYLQGICPVGWHLPSDREWNELEKELYNNAHKYSQFKDDGSDTFVPATWQDNNTLNWESGVSGSATDWRGSSDSFKGHALVMVSECVPSGSIYINSRGKSLSAARGGFDALLVGSSSSNSVYDYGYYGFFWVASSRSNSSAWYRHISPSSKVSRNNAARFNLFSVRCKKD